MSVRLSEYHQSARLVATFYGLFLNISSVIAQTRASTRSRPERVRDDAEWSVSRTCLIFTERLSQE